VTGVRIGYLVPEFPGQTHVMFWRELDELRRRGVVVDVVSTRRPRRALSAHPWSRQAAAATTYLFPPGPTGMVEGLRAWAAAGRVDRRAATRALLASPRPPRRVAQRLAAAGLGARLAWLARRRAWAHVHVHSCAAAADVALFSRLLGGSPYSLTLHGPLGDYGPDQQAKWGGAEFGIVITRRLEAELRAALGSQAPEHLAVSGMGVSPGTFARPAPYEAWTGAGPAVVFSCGRLNPAKGHLDLVRAVRLVRERGLPAHLTIAGEDEQGGTGYRRVLERAIDELGLADAVTLLGAVPEDEVRRRLHGAHVFALASVAEPLGVVLMEAMAAGVPVVATRAGGVPELVTDGSDGILVPPRDPVAMADALQQVLADVPRACELSAAAAASAARRAAAPSSAEVLLELITTAGHRLPTPVAETPP
jgi:glycosyltransferase involved in cell wall biosynthesis